MTPADKSVGKERHVRNELPRLHFLFVLACATVFSQPPQAQRSTRA